MIILTKNTSFPSRRRCIVWKVLHGLYFSVLNWAWRHSHSFHCVLIYSLRQIHFPVPDCFRKLRNRGPCVKTLLHVLCLDSGLNKCCHSSLNCEYIYQGSELMYTRMHNHSIPDSEYARKLQLSACSLPCGARLGAGLLVGKSLRTQVDDLDSRWNGYHRLLLCPKLSVPGLPNERIRNGPMRCMIQNFPPKHDARTPEYQVQRGDGPLSFRTQGLALPPAWVPAISPTSPSPWSPLLISSLVPKISAA